MKDEKKRKKKEKKKGVVLVRRKKISLPHMYTIAWSKKLKRVKAIKTCPKSIWWIHCKIFGIPWLYKVAYSIMRCAYMDYEAMLWGDVNDYNTLNEFCYNYHL